jgi:hypothetical protein
VGIIVSARPALYFDLPFALLNHIKSCFRDHFQQGGGAGHRRFNATRNSSVISFAVSMPCLPNLQLSVAASLVFWRWLLAHFWPMSEAFLYQIGKSLSHQRQEGIFAFWLLHEPHLNRAQQE